MFLLLLAQLGHAGACNCGAEYYLARAEGEADAKPQNPDECYGEEGGPGDLECLTLDGWDPHLTGDELAAQTRVVERVLAVVGAHPEAADEAASAFVGGAVWRIADPALRERVAAVMTAHRGEAWSAGSATTGDAAALRRAILDRCSDRMALFQATGRREPLLGDLAREPPDGGVDAGRAALTCPGEATPWRDWGWVALGGELDPRQLWMFDDDDRAFLKNAVYARRGRPFTSARARAMFADTWRYTPDPDYSDERLTDLDRRNLHVILNYDKARDEGMGHGQAATLARTAVGEGRAAPPAPIPAPPPPPQAQPSTGLCAALALPITAPVWLLPLVALRRRRR